MTTRLLYSLYTSSLSSLSSGFMGFGTMNTLLHRLRSTISNKLTASMASTSENGGSNAHPKHIFVVLMFPVMFYFDEYLVMPTAMFVDMVMLASMIYNLNMPCLHFLNHDAMIYLSTYDYIFAMINFLYVIIFMCIFF